MSRIYKGRIAHVYEIAVSMKRYQGHGHKFSHGITHVETSAEINCIMVKEELIPDGKNNTCKRWQGRVI